EKSEGFQSPLAALLTSQGREPAELDQPRLVLVERQAKLGQSVLEINQHPPRIRRFLKAHHEVVSVAHDRDPTGRVPPPPLVNPEIENVVQEDVGAAELMANTGGGSIINISSIM